MLKKLLRRHFFWLLFLATTFLFLVAYFSIYSTNYKSDAEAFQSTFIEKEQQLEHFLEEKARLIEQKEGKHSLANNPTEDPFLFHYYQKDSLVFWNSNQIPILKFADIHFPSSGVIHAQNGWYYSKVKHIGSSMLCASFLIKNDYPYENENLINTFSAEFQLSFNTIITLDQENGYPIRSKNDTYLFSLLPNNYQPANTAESIYLFLAFYLSVLFLLLAISTTFLKIKAWYSWLFIPFVLLLRFASLKLLWFGFLHDTTGFQASLYGTNAYFPSFFDYFLNCTLILLFVYFIWKKCQQTTLGKFKKIAGILLFLSAYLFWSFTLYLGQGLIENSSISLSIEALFSLDVFSVLSIISLGLLGYALFLLVKTSIRLCKKQELHPTVLPVLAFVAGVIYFIIEINFGHQLLFAGLFPLFFFSLVLYFENNELTRGQLTLGLALLALFSLVTAVDLAEFNRRKDKSERKLYANKLVSDKDIVTEDEYARLKQQIATDKYLLKFISSQRKLDPRDFKEGMERRHFNGYWERYDVGFHLFDKKNESLLKFQGSEKKQISDLNDLISKHGQRSEMDSSIFFISDYTGQYSYVIRQEIITKDSTKGTLFCALKSKKIPEEIGFPRLLISSKAVAFEHLENYSVAKYHKNKLVSKYGKFNYPTSVTALKNANPNKYNNFNFQGHNHFMLYKSGHDVIVLSGKNITWVDIITSFSYLFCFYGLLLLPIFFGVNNKTLFQQSFTLSAKIQLVLIGLVFVSLLGFGWGSGVFVRNQYNEYTNDVIREKLHSIETEFKGKVGKEADLDIHKDGTYVNYLLEKFSKVFVTDINMYDPNGYLLGTSRQKVFNMGLLSEQMNPLAKRQLRYLDKSEFIHQEKIGELSYSSAYLPFYNNEGKLLGFINLQHFGQQEDFEHQIQRFLVAIINVFMLLLAISIVLAIFASNWVTTPLRILQQRFANVQFGKYNQKIDYAKDDEIGVLVKNYNAKLEELEYTASQLAQSERETAWREMAKQVAHEIKNPLTPMKLSVQQLLRSFDPNDPDSAEKLERVSNSLVEQIDALTKITNEFSNFAKMPQPNMEKVNLVDIIQNVVGVFNQGNKRVIKLTSSKVCIIEADKDQLVRVFNNLIKNAIQATDEDGVIQLSLIQNRNDALVTISDNGIGIPEEEKAKVFVPYFTTKSAGTGIGLAMVKQIILNHQGDIYFESRKDVGTTFTIEFPLPK